MSAISAQIFSLIIEIDTTVSFFAPPIHPHELIKSKLLAVFHMGDVFKVPNGGGNLYHLLLRENGSLLNFFQSKCRFPIKILLPALFTNCSRNILDDHFFPLHSRSTDTRL